ncbi:MAG: DUF502 domain-containing protein [Bacteroidetes bacterium]|nr:DUF502 domain-containing protein [Bacteroidota bacterium]
MKDQIEDNVEMEVPLKGAKRIINYVIQGFFLLLPVIMMMIVISIVFNFILGVLKPISIIISADGTPHWSLHIASAIILIFILYGAGIMITNRMGKIYYSKFERTYLSRIPLYSTLKDLTEQFSGRKEMPFKQVALVDVFNSGVLMTGFVTQVSDNGIHTLYVPTAPNPANGNIYHIPKERLIFLNIGPEEAMRTIIGMGTGSDLLLKSIREDQEIPNQL